MARSVDDVDVIAVPIDRGIFRQDGDTPFFFQGIGVHDTFIDFCVSVEGAGLLQKLVNQGGFAMVNVSDDGDISEFFYHRIYLGFLKNR
jgi:hypothetical protein